MVIDRGNAEATVAGKSVLGHREHFASGSKPLVEVTSTNTTPGKGKKNGTLHEVTALELATQVLNNIKDRNTINTADVDDVVLGCVAPVGEQGACIARTAVLNADYDQSVSGVQINRFCASGLEATNMAAAQVMSGQAQMSIGGGVESMSRVPMGSDGGAMVADPEVAIKNYFVP